MPNSQQYSGSNHAYAPGHHGFTGNPQAAAIPARPSHPPQHQHPVVNQQQPHQPGSVYSNYMQPVVQAPYPQPGNPAYANQPVPMPTAPTDRRYAHHSEVASSGGQPQFPPTRYPETYPQYGYPAGNMQSVYGTAYPPGDSPGFCQPGSAVSPVNGQCGYMNGTYPPVETRYGQPHYPPQVHSSDDMSRRQPPYPPQVHNSDNMARLGAQSHSRNAAGFQPQSQQFGVTGNADAQVDPSHRAVAHQQSRDAEEQRDSSSDITSGQSKNSAPSNVVNRRQAKQHSNPHIVKPAVLHSTTTGNFLYCHH